MGTSTTNLLLYKPDGTEFVLRVTDLNDNWDKIDAAAGVTICTSSTRPSTGLINGRLIYETDTKSLLIRQTSSGGFWAYISTAVVANTTARDALTPTVTGMLAITTDTDTLWQKKASGWATPWPDDQALQQVTAVFSSVATTTALIPADDTIPQIGEGAEFMTVSITPKFSTSRLEIEATAFAATVNANNIIGALFRDATSNALFAAQVRQPVSSAVMQLMIQHSVTAGSTAATTFRVRLGSQAADTLTFNGNGGTRLFGAISKSSLTVTEWRV
jgi:predicted Rdx family selenoprotein